MIYEGLLLLGVIAAADFIFLTGIRPLFQLQQNNVSDAWILKLWLFFIIGLYFIFFWVRSGQTLAMKTWRIRLEDNENKKLPVIKATVRYFLVWAWFLPGFAIAAQLKLSPWASLSTVSIVFLIWAITAAFDKNGQFLHDKLAKTRLIHLDPASPKALT
jgi:uncharacterized RDD family membrane protein YckC